MGNRLEWASHQRKTNGQHTQETKLTITSEMQIKTTVATASRRVATATAGGECGQAGTPTRGCWECRTVQPLETVWQVLKLLNVDLP